MTSTTVIRYRQKRYYVEEHMGPFSDIYGPYRFKWMAKIVAWFFNNDH